MTQEDAQVYVSLADFVVKQAEAQAASTKLFLLWLDGLESRLHLHRRLAEIPDSEEKRSIVSELAEKESAMVAEIAAMRQPMRDTLARIESDHEKMQHVLAILRASLSKPPGQA